MGIKLTKTRSGYLIDINKLSYYSPQTDEGVKARVQADVATRAATVRSVLCLMIELSMSRRDANVESQGNDKKKLKKSKLRFSWVTSNPTKV